jgi:FKBP-type peptidyl-prolyl cis-trans isomerase
MRLLGCITISLVVFLWGCKPSGEEGTPPPEKDTAEETKPESPESPAAPEKDTRPAAETKTTTETAAKAPAGPRLPPFEPQGKIGDLARKPNMKVLPSGLEYAVLQTGSGETPSAGATVKVHITGWIHHQDRLLKEFLNSRDDGVPQQLELTELKLIKGLLIMLADMKRGERRWVLVPADLGYGDTEYGRTVLPKQNLAFDVELVFFE